MDFDRISFFSVFIYTILRVSILGILLMLILLPILGFESPSVGQGQDTVIYFL